jgi:hypothetical protein
MMTDTEVTALVQEARYGTDCPVSGDFNMAVREAILAGYRAGVRDSAPYAWQCLSAWSASIDQFRKAFDEAADYDEAHGGAWVINDSAYQAACSKLDAAYNAALSKTTKESTVNVIGRDGVKDIADATTEDMKALAAAQPDSRSALDMMVDRFLCWPLPRDFGPDCGISFDGRKDDEWNKNKTWPVGTNLFTAEQARAMLQHVLSAPAPLGVFPPEVLRLLGLAVKAITAEQAGTVVNHYGTQVRITSDRERNVMDVADFWIALEERGLDTNDLVAAATPKPRPALCVNDDGCRHADECGAEARCLDYKPAVHSHDGYKSVGWQYRFPSAIGGHVWRDSAEPYNEMRFEAAREIFVRDESAPDRPTEVLNEAR